MAKKTIYRWSKFVWEKEPFTLKEALYVGFIFMIPIIGQAMWIIMLIYGLMTRKKIIKEV